MDNLSPIQKVLFELEMETTSTKGFDYSPLLENAKNSFKEYSLLESTSDFVLFQIAYERFVKVYNEKHPLNLPNAIRLANKLVAINEAFKVFIQTVPIANKEVKTAVAERFLEAQSEGNKEELLIIEKDLQSRLLKGSYPDSYNILLTEVRRVLSELPTKRQRQFEFVNNTDFVHLPTEKIYNYFKSQLVDSRHLDLETLHKYLKSAFEDGKPPKEKFKIDKKGLSKASIKKIWVEFSTTFQKFDSVQYGQKSKYVRLLTDYFDDYQFYSNGSNWR